ncbi:hypothetical protein BJF93_01850 [Xaviernesmea oryzae]|uniref:DUF3750 domain-containing protein n=1 Tax=Xaviernesmea oryzae TaxID=464029 RepID=A0A1Q9B3E4_9HYPH|nr:DUF3750 domain-containing protein [Xaviernesmea oryzae]OLP62562.1 hypothetical protein BJF93_01850 [Xaviernesmea oryzae]SEM19465.1 Protein of unknown function [Xaviernesmea oryzae]
MPLLRLVLVSFLLVYLLPALASAGIWYMRDRPASWREADWTSAGILPPPQADAEPAVYVLSAATGGMKGAVSSHSWIVLKKPGASSYARYDKVGWGTPIRRNAYPADARWYSNPPELVVARRGPEAMALIPKVEAAIAAYPYNQPGAYRLFPGPNSNSFVAHVLRSVPELHAVLPPHAVGRDYLPEGRFFAVDADGRDVHATLYGLIGLSAGWRSGLELHILGLVAGLDLRHPGLKIPAFGRIGF